MTISDEERRVLARWAANCAKRVLHLFEAKVPSDTRPREAIEGARAFARNGKRTAQLRTLVWAAYAAARESGDPIAAAAARAAGLAAGAPYIHALANVGQAKHILGPAVYAARARGLAVDPSAGDKELRWAIEHVPPALRKLLRRMPARRAGRGPFDVLYYQLDVGLRR